jgi:hypothetical protein
MVRFVPIDNKPYLILSLLITAKDLHTVNASTRVMREQMEATFRKELVRPPHILYSSDFFPSPSNL